jgi:phosphohistidine phosphatase SixA
MRDGMRELRMMKPLRRALTLALLLTTVAAFAAPPKVTTIIIARHAEKAGPQGDVPLSEAGHARADELARVLGGAGVTAVYDTQFARTQQTAAPLAAALHLTPMHVETTPAYAKTIVHDIDQKHAGQTVVVVSHSNTIPDVLKELGIAQPPPIGDTQYDDLFIVTRVKGAPPKLTALRYGVVAR